MRLRVLPFQFAFLSMAFLGSLWGQARNESPKQELKQQTVPLSPQELFKRLSPSVFIVEVLDRKDTVIAFGSGICIAPNLIVTNNHVIEDGASVRIRQGSKTWPARVMAQDGDHDLCDLEVNGLEAPAVSVRPSSSLEVGERVYSIGAPEGLELTFSEGLISSFRTYKQTQVIQTTAAISHGSSGGGLFDARGQLAGITTFFIEEGQSLNFAIPGELALAISQHQKQTLSLSPRFGSPGSGSVSEGIRRCGHKGGETISAKAERASFCLRRHEQHRRGHRLQLST